MGVFLVRAPTANKTKAKIAGLIAPTAVFLAQKRRLRVPKNLPLPRQGRFAWAKSQPELARFGPGEQARWLRESDEWKTIMKPHLDALDRRRVFGPTSPYTSEELELVCFYEKAAGFLSTKDALLRLEGPRSRRDRERLGFDRVRDAAAAARQAGLGTVPSQATFSRHRNRLGDKKRAELWETLLEQLADRQLATVDDEELRIIYLDGTDVPVVYTCPVIKRRGDGTTYVENERAVTCKDGGVTGKRTQGKSHGFAIMAAWTPGGARIAHRVTKINNPEKTLGPTFVREEIAPKIRQLRAGKAGLGVLSADSIYATAEFRREVRKMGYIENTHHVSHANEKNAAAKDRAWIPFMNGKEPTGWGTNGHHELLCECGQNRNERVFALRGTGARERVVPRVEGTCSTHGSFTLTVGRWVQAENPKRWIRYDPNNDPPVDEETHDARLAAGNSLTFNDPLAAAYGKMRWSHNEGVHGALATRWKLTFGKRFFKTIDHVRIEAAMVFTAMSVCALERHRVEAGEAASALLAA